MTVYVLFVDYRDNGPEVCCGVFTSEAMALQFTSDRYSYRVQVFALDVHA